MTSEEHLSWVEDVVGVKGVLDGLHGLEADIADLLLHQAAFPNSYAVLPGAGAMQFHRQPVTHGKQSLLNHQSDTHMAQGQQSLLNHQSDTHVSQGQQSLLNH